MSRDRLADLLHRADDAAPPPPAPQRLAERVRARARARARRQRLAAAVTAPLLLIGASALLLLRPSPGEVRQAQKPAEPTPVEPRPVPASRPHRAALHADAARLHADAAMRLSVAEGLRARGQRRAAAARTAGRAVVADTLTSVDAEREKAALTLLDHGDRLRRDLNQVSAALAAYRRTIELFPDTRWAAVAKRRIDELDPGARRDANQSFDYERTS